MAEEDEIIKQFSAAFDRAMKYPRPLVVANIMFDVSDMAVRCVDFINNNYKAREHVKD